MKHIQFGLEFSVQLSLSPSRVDSSINVYTVVDCLTPNPSPRTCKLMTVVAADVCSPNGDLCTGTTCPVVPAGQDCQLKGKQE